MVLRPSCAPLLTPGRRRCGSRGPLLFPFQQDELLHGKQTPWKGLIYLRQAGLQVKAEVLGGMSEEDEDVSVLEAGHQFGGLHDERVEGEEWGEAGSSMDQDEEDDDWGGLGRFCINCTCDLLGDECMACGHTADCDQQLLNAGGLDDPSSPAAAALEAASRQLSSMQQVALIWDERMELHEEAGGSSPHPERPDRVRTIMARLLASRLAGVLRSWTRKQCGVI